MMDCPICKETMVKHRMETEDGKWMFGWLCGCNEELRKQAVDSPVPCSEGLVGLTAWDVQCIRTALCLMNSMILGGEQHSGGSTNKFNEAMEVLWGAN